jgi:putative oxidoreductase
MYVAALRIFVGLVMASHGCVRIYAGTVGNFGGFLESSGFPAGVPLAWGITIFEIAGGLTLAAGFLRRWIPLVFVIEHLVGITLVHAQHGWFVVGHTQGGPEFSVLLILCFLLTASTADDNTPVAGTGQK